jgi:CRISPR-associated protein Csm4
VALFRVKIALMAPLGTPLTSGSLFGQLCWMKRARDGEAALVAWLAAPERLWALSDGFPAGLLPRPLLPPAPPSDDAEVAKAAKAEKKKAFVTREGFLVARTAMNADALRPHLRRVEEAKPRFAHNTIDRRTGSTPESGGLYFLDEDWGHATRRDERATGDAPQPAGPLRDVYVAAEPEERREIGALFADLGEEGFGRDATFGRGRWRLDELVEDRELAEGPEGRLLSLSCGAALPEMGDLRCRLAAHYGKAGPGVAVGEGASPFKKPLLLTLPGATFTGSAKARHGDWLTGVHPTRPEIGHNAFHVVVPFREAAHAA